VVKSLLTYADRIKGIEGVLQQFINTGVIDRSKLGAFDDLAQAAYGDELKILNSARLTLDEQRSLFGVVRNVHMTAKAMAAKLASASQKHENPSTADRALAVCDTMLNVSPIIDAYFKTGEVPERRIVRDSSLTLYKKAKQSGFSEDAATQFKELNISSDEISKFTKKLEESIETRVDADNEEEELESENKSGPVDESSN
jgi:hypothetical protein